MEELKFPIGRFTAPAEYPGDLISKWINDIAEMPALLEKEVLSLNQEQLDTPYRDGGWTVRQLVHHLADSHANAFIRIKLALTEPETPTITAYRQDDWANLPDSKLEIEISLQILRGIHSRWVYILRNIKTEDWEKGFIHPEKGRRLSVKEATGTYAWHCLHHVAHIKALKKRKGW